MAYIESNPLSQTAILKIYSERNEIIVDPKYQRNGDIWGLDKRQLLIDSIINDYDIPKIYYHKLDAEERLRTGKTYAIIDGRQRLETIWKFIDGEFALAQDFEYLKDENVKAAGLTYSDLGKKYPKLKINFDSISLSIIAISTNDLELIEDMFSRLNEAVPLNAAEKRNAYGGAMARLISDVSEHKLFSNCVSFSNKRYQHKDAAAKVLFIVDSMNNARKRIIDTKKVYLDEFVKSNKKASDTKIKSLKKTVVEVLDGMSSIFIKKDPLLSAQGTFPVYFLLVKEYVDLKEIEKLSRDTLVQFKEKLIKNREQAEKDIASAEFDLLEYDRLSQQGTNDASSILTRFNTLKKYIKTE